MNDTITILKGIVGSTAYGLATENSDIDRIGIFTWPTANYLGLNQPKDNYVTTSPDQTMHEVAKYCRLALSANPTVMEILWLPEHLYEERTHLADKLIEIRSAFPSRHHVRNAYLGYATQQFQKLSNRGDGSFSVDTRKRTAKHARHIMRLCLQGFQLWCTGEVRIDFSDIREELLDFGAQVAAGNIQIANYLIVQYSNKFDREPTVLPERPDRDIVEAWLQLVRKENYHAT